jgi:ATP-dependent exoDNAse (exonuclease V) beta subunit
VLREIFGVSDHALAEFAGGRPDRFQIEEESEGSDAVAACLNLLWQVHRSVADQPLFTAVERVVQTTGLRERLRALPPEDYVDLEHEFDVLLQSAAAAEANGATLEEFAELLRANFTTERESSQPRAGAIQLITCQKAKGLEWDAIIVPFLARRVHTADENFPRVLPASQLERALVVFSKATMPSDAKEVLKTAHRHEMERLLYVAFTRARHTLVLAQDRELFAKAGGGAVEASLLSWLKADAGSPNEARLAQLRTEARAEGEVVARTVPRAAAIAQPKLPAAKFDAAQKNADNFPRRQLPSALARDEPLAPAGADQWEEMEWEFRPATLPSAATRYGTWWHGLMQQLTWTDAATWDDLFAEFSRSAPDATRSRREWNRFRKRVASVSDFPFAPASIAATQAEIPLLWPVNERTCVEGVLDLALFGSVDNQVLVVDWKTNMVGVEQIERLRLHYRPQMAAYAAAVTNITGRNVRAAIYSTAVGEFVTYDTIELEREWNAPERSS